MLIGVPSEIKSHEYRVGMLPAGVELLVGHGHEVIMQKDAGTGSGYEDSQYIAAGAEIVDSHAEVFDRAQMIVKVK